MSKVTSKRQVTIPKSVATRYGIVPGAEIRWIPAGDEIRVVPEGADLRTRLTPAARLELFDRATARRDQRTRETPPSPALDRGWSRDELHDRGRSR
jgi:bifunctional DNA-binding transcriptional regulator/antitoxin component of YhaV-PrlF toxin-antitoxin module